MGHFMPHSCPIYAPFMPHFDNFPLQNSSCPSTVRQKLQDWKISPTYAAISHFQQKIKCGAMGYWYLLKCFAVADINNLSIISYYPPLSHLCPVIILFLSRNWPMQDSHYTSPNAPFSLKNKNGAFKILIVWFSTTMCAKPCPISAPSMPHLCLFAD